MFKFLHVADIHLDSPLRGLERYEGAPADEIRQASRRAMQNLVQLAIDESANLVLIAGDLYDGDWKDHRTGLYFVSQMVRLREAGIRVVLIAGNHDAANKMTRTLPMPENVQLLDHKHPQSVSFDDLGVIVHGQSFATGAVTEDLSMAYPSAVGGMVNIGLLHTCVNGREGHLPYAPCKLEGLQSKHYDYWALGHAHRREELCSEPHIIFSGNIQGRHIREDGPKGCMLVHVDDQHRLRTEFRPLDVFRWQSCWVDATGADTPHELLDRIRQRLGDLLKASDGLPLAVRVETGGPCSAHRQLAAEPQQWVNEIRSTALDLGAGRLWIEKVRISTSLPVNLDDALEADGPLGELARLIEELKSDPEMLGRLLGDDMAELKKKLPPELTEGPESLDLGRGSSMGELLEQVRQMLVSQLGSQEHAS
jgi:DNA repair exonuclease SbcCD nuclease subunit